MGNQKKAMAARGKVLPLSVSARAVPLFDRIYSPQPARRVWRVAGAIHLIDSDGDFDRLRRCGVYAAFNAAEPRVIMP